MICIPHIVVAWDQSASFFHSPIKCPVVSGRGTPRRLSSSVHHLQASSPPPLTMSLSLSRQNGASFSSRSIQSLSSGVPMNGASFSSRSIQSLSSGVPMNGASFSSRSVRSLSSGVPMVGSGHTLTSSGGTIQSYAPSMHGGAGGFGTRVSRSFSTGLLTPFSESAVISNEKVTMQDLNDRLASYLEKVRSLEAANRKLELQIREYYEKRGPTASQDFTHYYAIIADLRDQIKMKHLENRRIILKVDNAQLAADDFKIKYETELNMHTMVQADVLRLRGVRDSLTIAISDLEVQIEGLKEELVYIKRNHEEELQQLRIQQTGTVNVEVDSAESVDLTLVLQEMREQYEALVLRNKQELEKWFQAKVALLETKIKTCSVEVTTSYTELSELKRTYQSLEISRQSVITEIQCLQQSVDETKSRFNLQLSQLQRTIDMLQEELKQLILSLEQQQTEYDMLLDIKMRLELEIAEYRRLLDGETREKGLAVVISKVVEVEEQKPHIERRVKTIVEEIVDGQVVSSTVDTQVEDIQ
ncbi:keratin, type I cytoskeletal 19-like [Plectropomus leopardus]|uniref:keratin, type I cytoskeletal 19-like n=1 Tax=Plectropomus leopardus TaxID=160734 RepID=UPI001C4B95A1|nr:keratin, type I cytoskeletal 19-like [Plectropomus leopardus]